MRKIAIPIILLLFMPALGNAANDFVTGETINLTVNGIDLKMVAGQVDKMVVGDTTITYTLSSGSSLGLRSEDKYSFTNSLDIEPTCADTYSQLDVNGNSLGSTLVVTISSSASKCQTTVTDLASGGGGGGGGSVVSIPTTPTTSNGQVTATASGGGKTTLTTDQGGTAVVELPANAVSASTVVNISTQAKSGMESSNPAPSSRTIVGDYVYDYTATANGTAVSDFSKNLTLTFTYTDDQIGELDESNLRIFYWDEDRSQWVALPTTVDAENNTVTGEVNHFTYFAIMALSGDEGEEEIIEEETSSDSGTSEDSTVSLADGDLVQNPNAEGMAQFDIYIVKIVGEKKFKRLILSPHVFESYEHFDKNGNGSPWDDVLKINQATMDQYTVSDLVRAVGDSKVYRLSAGVGSDTGTKQWLNMTAGHFASQGYDSDSIYEINEVDRNAYVVGAAITSGEADSQDTIIITTSFLRVRSLPSLDGEVLTEVNQDEVYTLLDEDNGWYKITANGVTGWCYRGNSGEYAAKQ